MKKKNETVQIKKVTEEGEMKILIVEDDVMLRKMYSDKVRVAGHEAVEAANGLEGLQMAKQEAPDVILLDVMMPGMDGLEMLEKLRKSDWGAYMKVIVLTAKEPDDGVMGRVTKSEPSYFLSKATVTPEGIMNFINKLVEEGDGKNIASG